MLLSSREHMQLEHPRLQIELYLITLSVKKQKTQDENLRKAVERKMNKLKDDKLSITMKVAMARNVVAANKMKAAMGAMSFEQQKNLQSMEYYKNKYAKRQRELQNEKQRMLNSRMSNDGKDQRKISAPAMACMVTVVEYKDASDGGCTTQLRPRPQSTRPRSISVPDDDACRLPSLLRGENSTTSPEPTTTKNESLTLPTILSNGSNQGPQRKSSATSIAVPASTDLMVQTVAISQTRSAPNSPCATRREMMQSPSPRGHSKSPARTLPGMDSLTFDNVREKLMADMNVALASTKQFHPERQQSVEVTGDVKEQGLKTSSESFKEIKGNPKTRKISCPGTKLSLSPTRKQASNGDNDTTLEGNLNKIRYCQYLRSPSLQEDDERLPDELIPKAIIGGHMQWVPGD